MASRAETIRNFCEGFSAGALLTPPSGSEACQDGWAHGRLACRAALNEYLRDRGLKDLGSLDLEFFLRPATAVAPQTEPERSA